MKMIFEEFVLRKYMGPPVTGTSWRCPFCKGSKPTFSLFPPKRKPDGSWHKIRWQCWRVTCGERGDLYDFLKMFPPGIPNYNDRLALVETLRVEYAAELPYLISGSGGVTILNRLLRDGLIDHDDLLEVVAELNHALSLRREIALMKLMKLKKKKRLGPIPEFAKPGWERKQLAKLLADPLSKLSLLPEAVAGSKGVNRGKDIFR